MRFNLRYPGQYFDAESGLHYNYFRSYDPRTGRYTQADPIGLEGGFNRFSYVGGNPLGDIDPTGLTSLAGCANPVNAAACAAAGGGGAAIVGGTGVTEMAAPGNVEDTKIREDYEKYASAERLCGKEPMDRCKWLALNSHNYPPAAVKATEKAWGCRGSRHSKGGGTR